ncbi:SDR family oxidoreductase [Candidatus Litorirhabdus singularis]|uniref:SDR family oxidoreductase n=1 Tax=Candidatus Litorirhabdus singularis TaxID=2518993 RepID=UPI0024303601|nr:SDR family oxidoreductase [Candidatus Litorirhabdus singularis]
MDRIGDSLAGKRVLITQSEEFMGPALCKGFAAYGAEVIAAPETLAEPGAAEALVERSGRVDVLIANLAIPAPRTAIVDVTEEEWRHAFSHLVDPLPRLFRALLPQMLDRGEGKIVVMGSASALRGMPKVTTYSAARGAQIAYVRAAGAEVAAENIQINLIAQNFVDNPTYFPPEVQELDAFQRRLRNEVPLGRLATPEEDAQFAVFLASSEVNFFVGQSFAFSGGWVT